MDMQFYDWVLTSVDKVRFSMSGPPSLCLSQRLSRQFHILWCRERITDAWVLSALARYLALVCRYGRHTRNKEQRAVKLDKFKIFLRIATIICSEHERVSIIGYWR